MNARKNDAVCGAMTGIRSTHSQTSQENIISKPMTHADFTRFVMAWWMLCIFNYFGPFASFMNAGNLLWAVTPHWHIVYSYILVSNHI